MTDAPDARNNDDIVESPYFQLHEAFVTEPAESLELDRARNRLLTVHPHHGMAANYAIRAKDLRVAGCVQTWALTATSLQVGVDYVVFLTHPYGKLVKAGRDGRVLDRYEIWHRYLTSLVLMGDLLFVTDRRWVCLYFWKVGGYAKRGCQLSSKMEADKRDEAAMSKQPVSVSKYITEEVASHGTLT